MSQVTLQDLDSAPDSTGRQELVESLEGYKAAFLRVSEEKSLLQEKHGRLKKKVKTTKILDSLIKPYAFRVFVFMCVYCSFVAIVLLMWSFGCFENQLSDDVLTILVGSTAVTVIGLVGMVVTGIFIGARPKG